MFCLVYNRLDFGYKNKDNNNYKEYDTMDIKVDCVSKIYGNKNNKYVALDNVSCHIKSGEFLCIMGESGSGKSTLLNLMAGFDNPSSGKIFLGNTVISNLSENERAIFRQKHLGFIFQSFCLLNDLSALENVLMPLLILGENEKKSREKAKKILEELDLGTKLNNKPEELSGGQQQRVAIARALVSDVELIMADEPTGKLDSKNATEVLNILKNINQKYNKTIIMVTHSKTASVFADKIIYIKDGKIADIGE